MGICSIGRCGMFGGSWKRSISPKEYSKHADVYNAAHQCREYEDPASCTQYAYALIHASILERNPALARTILTHVCASMRHGEGCRMFGDLVDEMSDPSTEDPVAERLSAYKSACFLGDPTGCRQFAETLQANDPRRTYQSLAVQYHTWAIQLSQQALQSHSVKTNAEAEEPSIDLGPVQRLPKSETTVYYPIPTRSRDDEGDYHMNIAISLTRLLQAQPDQELELVDLRHLASMPLDLDDYSERFKRTSIYKANAMAGKYAQGYYYSDQVDPDATASSGFLPSWSNTLLQASLAPLKQTGEKASPLQMAEWRDHHMAEALKRYQAVCARSLEEGGSCYPLATLWKELYDLRHDQTDLKNALQALQKGCAGGEQFCCSQLGDMYATSYQVPGLSEGEKQFNHEQAKRYYYQSCKASAGSCMDLATVLRQEGDIETAIRMVTHACKVGNNPQACKILHEQLREEKKEKGETSLLGRASELIYPRSE